MVGHMTDEKTRPADERRKSHPVESLLANIVNKGLAWIVRLDGQVS